MSPDVILIGGGVLGLSTGHTLLQRGTNIAVLNGGQVGQSSWAGAGIVCPLMPWNYSEEVNRLALTGMQNWPQWAATLQSRSGINPEFWPCGMEVQMPLRASAHEKDFSVASALDWCHQHGLPARKLTDYSLRLPTVAQVRNPRLLKAAVAAIEASGGSFLPDCNIETLITCGRRVLAVQAGTQQHKADVFVLATGAWSGLPLGHFSALPNIRPVRGQMLLYAPDSHTLGHILYRDGVYLVPRRDGHLLVGSTLEDAGFEATTTAGALTGLHKAACELLPELRTHSPIKSWAGLRPGSPDNLPLIDRHPDFDNLWIHTGHFRYGVTMAPASSQLLTELMFGETPSIDPTPYSWQAALKRRWAEDTPC